MCGVVEWSEKQNRKSVATRKKKRQNTDYTIRMKAASNLYALLYVRQTDERATGANRQSKSQTEHLHTDVRTCRRREKSLIAQYIRHSPNIQKQCFTSSPSTCSSLFSPPSLVCRLFLFIFLMCFDGDGDENVLHQSSIEAVLLPTPCSIRILRNDDDADTTIVASFVQARRHTFNFGRKFKYIRRVRVFPQLFILISRRRRHHHWHLP